MDVLAHWRRAPAILVFAEGTLLAFAGILLSNRYLSTSGTDSGAAAIATVGENVAETIGRALAFPPLETLLWQALPAYVCARFGMNRWLSVFVPAVLFAIALHWSRGLGAMVSAFWLWSVLGAVFISQSTRLRAFVLTTLVHYVPVTLLVSVSLLIHFGVLTNPLIGRS